MEMLVDLIYMTAWYLLMKPLSLRTTGTIRTLLVTLLPGLSSIGTIVSIFGFSPNLGMLLTKESGRSPIVLFISIKVLLLAGIVASITESLMVSLFPIPKKMDLIN